MRSAILLEIKSKRLLIQKLEAEIKQLYDQLDSEQEHTNGCSTIDQTTKRLKRTASVDQKTTSKLSKPTGSTAEVRLKERKAVDLENLVVDRYSNLRIINSTANLHNMDRLMADRKFIHISNIALQACKDDDIRGNWITSGILFAPPKSRDVASFCCINLTDMSNTVRIFFFGDAKDQFSKLANGTIISILNPDILKPAEVACINSEKSSYRTFY
jgi:hypothetical protein